MVLDLVASLPPPIFTAKYFFYTHIPPPSFLTEITSRSL